MALAKDLRHGLYFKEVKGRKVYRINRVIVLKETDQVPREDVGKILLVFQNYKPSRGVFCAQWLVRPDQEVTLCSLGDFTSSLEASGFTLAFGVIVPMLQTWAKV